MTPQFDFDLFVIGAGSGGVRASRVASTLGARVAVAESRYLGGTCVNVGCVPKKLFVYGSHVHEELRAAAGYGWSFADAQFDWTQLRENKNREIERLNRIYAKLLDDAKVTLFNSHARIVGPHRIAIDDKEVSSKHILVATGGWPSVPIFPGNEHAITSNEVFFLAQLPKSIVIYGGGYIAVEFAGIFNGLGVETHLVYRGSLFLRGFDSSVREHLAKEMQKKGVNLHFDCTIESVSGNTLSSEKKLILSNGDELIVECVMAATGRKPLTDNLGLETTNVRLNGDGYIIVDENYQTPEPSIYAIGDVTGGVELTPVALAEGIRVANHLFGEEKTLSYDNIPTAIFSQPCSASVGLTEEQARFEYAKLNIFESEFRHLKHTLTEVQERTYMKLIVDQKTDLVVGCHMVGQDAAEIIQGLAIAMKAGATKAHFDATIGIHPSAAEEFVTLREISRH